MDYTISDNTIINKVKPKGQVDQVNKNFELTASEFDRMLDQMQKGDDSLFEKIYLIQFKDTMKYMMRRHRINSSQAYDICMEALLKFRRKLLSGNINYGNLKFLFNQIASQKFIDSLNKETYNISNKEYATEVNSAITNDHLDALEKAWQKLCNECSQLLENHYYKSNELVAIATNLNKSKVAIRKQKQRCLEKLRFYFLKYYQL